MNNGFRFLNQKLLLRTALTALLAGVGFATAGGCSLAGIFADKVAIRTVAPAYAGLKGKSVGFMVVAIKEIQLEHPRIEIDLGSKLTASLKAMQKAGSFKELEGSTFPSDASVQTNYAFLENYPNYSWVAPAALAPKLKAERLIHIEIDSFTYHADNVAELFRGELTARIRVVEVAGGVGKEVYNERLTAGFPTASGSRGGVGSLSLSKMETYDKTLETFAGEVAKRFVTHPEQAE